MTPSSVGPSPTTRFAPAPTGYLHLGHVANAIWAWGVAAARGGAVVLRIEDHDRQRCRPEYERALLDDLDWLGFVPTIPSTADLRAGPSPFRQSDCGTVYGDALDKLRRAGLVYACDCARSTFTAWAAANGRHWRGPGCPGACRERGLPERDGVGLRVVLGDGEEWADDLLAGRIGGAAAAEADLVVRDRHGNWTYHFAVVVDDIRHGVDLVVRGRDLLEATARQVRLGRLLGWPWPPLYAHHPLIRKPSGAKLSKADGDTGIRELRAAGATAAQVIGEAAAAIGLVGPGVELGAGDVGAVVYEALARPTTARMSAP